VRHLCWLALSCCIACGADDRRCEPRPEPGQLGAICGFRNPEDVESVQGAGLLLVSQMRHGQDGPAGSIVALNLYDPDEPAPRVLWPIEGATRDAAAEPGRCPGPPSADRFAPHGLAAGARRGDGSIPVAVVVHGDREAIEFFSLHGSGARATLRWRDCAILPPDAAGNDVVFAADGAILVTNYQPTLSGARGLLHTIRGGLGLDTGEVLEHRPEIGWRPVPGSRAPNPNGVLVSPDGRTVWLAATGGGAIVTVSRDGSTPRRREIAVEGHPDNLAWSTRGNALAMTHTGTLSILLCRLGARPCRAGWALFEIDPAGTEATLLLRHDGSIVGGVASVAEVDGRFYFGAIFDDRIGVWRPER
jgi:hypothetical protein